MECFFTTSVLRGYNSKLARDQKIAVQFARIFVTIHFYLPPLTEHLNKNPICRNIEPFYHKIVRAGFIKKYSGRAKQTDAMSCGIGKY